MISALSSRQLFITIAFGLAVLFELFCAIIVLKRDSKNSANRLTSFAYLSLALTLLFSLSYVIITDPIIVELLHRFVNFSIMITVCLLFITALYISEGYESLLSYRIVVVVIDILIGLYLLIAPGVSVIPKDETLSTSEQLIQWDFLFFLEVAVPLYITVILTCYYYLKVWNEIPTEYAIKRAILFILMGTALVGVFHFVLVIPLFLRPVINETLAISITMIGSVGVLLASFFIFWGYRTRITGQI